MTAEQKKMLSKRKYIYKVYASDNKIIHCEKYRVIYANSKAVYFKTAAKDDLYSVPIENVNDEFLGIRNQLNVSPPYRHYNTYGDRYYWKVEDFDSEKETENAFKTYRDDLLGTAEKKMNDKAADYEIAKQQYEALKKKFEQKEENKKEEIL
jgi:hypothetical protein